jgi:hypothetical protein
MLEMQDGNPVHTGEPSRRRPLRRRIQPVSVPDRPEPEEADRAAALISHTEERYQALQLRLDRLESAFRRLVQANRDAVRSTDRTAKALLDRIDTLVSSVEAVTARHEAALRAADLRHRAELTEFARRAGRAVTAVGVSLRDEFASSAQDIRAGLERLHLDLSTTAERIAGHEHPPAAATMSPQLEIALRDSTQRQEALLDRNLATILEALAHVAPRSEALGPAPGTKGVPSAGPRAILADGAEPSPEATPLVAEGDSEAIHAGNASAIPDRADTSGDGEALQTEDGEAIHTEDFEDIEGELAVVADELGGLSD